MLGLLLPSKVVANGFHEPVSRKCMRKKFEVSSTAGMMSSLPLINLLIVMHGDTFTAFRQSFTR